MDERKRLITTAFDLASDTYDGAWNRCFDLHAEALVREARIPEGGRVLDVATGTGKVACLAGHATGPAGQVVGIDLSDGMLAQARPKAAGLPVAFRRMDAEALEFDDGAFDVVVCGFGIAFFPDKVRAMEEMRRVLRPGGRMAFSWWTKDSQQQPLVQTTVARLDQYGVPRPPDPPEAWMALNEPKHLMTLLEKARFRKRRVVREAIGYFITPEDWWGFVWGSGWQRHLRKLPEDSLERFRAEILKDIGRLTTDQGIWQDASALIGIGLR